MKLGNKHYKPQLTLGMKHYKNHLTLGMKHYGQDSHNSGHTHNTPDGIINNNSNSNDPPEDWESVPFTLSSLLSGSVYPLDIPDNLYTF